MQPHHCPPDLCELRPATCQAPPGVGGAGSRRGAVKTRAGQVPRELAPLKRPHWRLRDEGAGTAARPAPHRAAPGGPGGPGDEHGRPFSHLLTPSPAEPRERLPNTASHSSGGLSPHPRRGSHRATGPEGEGHQGPQHRSEHTQAHTRTLTRTHTAPGGPLACVVARPPSGGWGAAPCCSEFESQQLWSCDHTLLSDLLKSGEKPRRNKHFFPGRGLGPQEPWSPGDGAALCTRAGLGRGTWPGTRARLSAPPGLPGQDAGSRPGAQAQDGVGRWGVCAALQALLHFPT